MNYINDTEALTASTSTQTTDKYDKNGFPLELYEWAKLLEDRDYSRVALHETKNYLFSTVWLGLDHRFGQEGEPLIFESMAFSKFEDGTRDSSGIYQERYSTLQGAKVGHYEMIVRIYFKRYAFHYKMVIKTIAKHYWNRLKQFFN